MQSAHAAASRAAPSSYFTPVAIASAKARARPVYPPPWDEPRWGRFDHFRLELGPAARRRAKAVRHA